MSVSGRRVVARAVETTLEVALVLGPIEAIRLVGVLIHALAVAVTLVGLDVKVRADHGVAASLVAIAAVVGVHATDLGLAESDGDQTGEGDQKFHVHPDIQD